MRNVNIYEKKTTLSFVIDTILVVKNNFQTMFVHVVISGTVL